MTPVHISYITDPDTVDLTADTKRRIGDYITGKLSVNRRAPDSASTEASVSGRPIVGGGQAAAFWTGDGPTDAPARVPDFSGISRDQASAAVAGRSPDDMTSVSTAVASALEAAVTSPARQFFQEGKRTVFMSPRQGKLGVHSAGPAVDMLEEIKAAGVAALESALGRAPGSPVMRVMSVMTAGSTGARESVGVQSTPDSQFESDSQTDTAKEALTSASDAVRRALSMRPGLTAGRSGARREPGKRPPRRKNSDPIQTRASYQSAVERGLSVLLDPGTASGSPGFYAALGRSLVTALGSQGTHSDQRVVGILNIIADVGDRALSADAAVSHRSTTAADGESPTDRVSKSKTAGGRLAWRTGALPSSYLLPDQVITAYESFTGRQGGDLLSGPVGSKIRPGSASRIPPKDVEALECLLDSEYVPFYFHDLRTNEIVAFHAFLESMTDDYAVEYESTSAYGRVDDVSIYSKTARSVSLEFSIVATNPEDFDEMWWKVNKLTTLLYPQWSEGRRVSSLDGRFVQPFSQVPTSSPLIRLRLGDVLRGNYSRFALARIFGLGSGAFDLGISIDTSQLDSEKVIATRRRMSQDPAVYGFEQGGYRAGEKAFLRPDSTGVGWESVDPTVPRLTSSTSVIVTFVDGGTVLLDADGIPYTVYTVSVTDPAADAASISRGPYVVPGHANFTASDEQVLVSAGAAVISENQTPEQIRSDVLNFFNPDTSAIGGGNSIVRSFESTAGKGLAGFITRMGFEWLTATWELGPGTCAPKLCKVRMDFKPIHDIAPGLDSSGFNRAPIYPVGRTVGRISQDIYAGRSEAEHRRRTLSSDAARNGGA